MAASHPFDIELLEERLKRTRPAAEDIRATTAHYLTQQPTRLAGEPHNLLDRRTLLHQCDDGSVLFLAAQPAGMLPAFGAAQHRWVDHITAHGLADRLHRPLHDGEERRAGVLHQMPSVGDLDCVRATISGGLDIAGATIPRDDLD